MSASPTRYDLLEKLGEGGAGAVFKAWDKRLQRYVAIKRLHPPDRREGDGVGTNLVKEAAALSSLQHPNIVSVYDLDEIDGEPCVVMEFLNGETLEQTVRRGALNLADFGAVARQSLEGLVAAHRLGVQHRDIKPSNFMVNWLPNGDFLVKMLDFGLADFTSRPHQQVAEGEGEAYGSVHFMAPEQFLRHPVDVRTDLYSLGCVCYYALTAEYPFDGRTMEDIINKHLRTTPSPVHELRGDVSTAMSEWVAWLMSREPGHRPQNTEEALDMFHKVLAGTVKTLGKSRMLKTQQVVKPITTVVRPGPTSNRPHTAPVPTRTAPTPGPVKHMTGSVTARKAPAPTAASGAAASAPKAQKKSNTGLIVGSTLAVVALGIGGLMLANKSEPQQDPDTVMETPTEPPVKNPVLWAKAGVGMMTNKGTTPAKLGQKFDYWQDQSSVSGPNPIHYIKTLAREDERQHRLPTYQDVKLKGKSVPVAHFDGSNCLLLATNDTAQTQVDIPSSIKENAEPNLTYAFICKPGTETAKMVLLSSSSPLQRSLWELYLENGMVGVGAGKKYATVPIPTGTQFMGILLSVSIQKKEAQLSVSFSKADPTMSKVVTDLLVDPAVDKVRLGGVASGSSLTNSKYYFIGELAEVHLYNRPLSLADRLAFHEYFVKNYL